MLDLGVESSPDKVVFLATEGGQLCHAGQIRAGVLRLREAVMLMNRSPNSQIGK